jgi:hypothetical protein
MSDNICEIDLIEEVLPCGLTFTRMFDLNIVSHIILINIVYIVS